MINNFTASKIHIDVKREAHKIPFISFAALKLNQDLIA